jgi:hypothetical protein
MARLAKKHRYGSFGKKRDFYLANVSGDAGNLALRRLLHDR